MDNSYLTKDSTAAAKVMAAAVPAAGVPPAYETPNGSPKPRFLAIDFFCGAGGTTRGLLDAGGYVIAGIDNDASCRETFVRNNDNTMLDCKPPTFLALDMFPASSDYQAGQQQEVWNQLNVLIPYYRRLAPEIPMLFAICAPCQSFTRFVQRRLSDDRASDRDRDRNLLSQTIDFVKKFKPDMVVSENVANIERGRYRHIWDEFRSQLSEWYDTGSKRICASRFGVPQYRRRSILLGLLRLETDAPALFDLPVPSFDPAVPSTRSVKGAIGGLPALDAGEKHDAIANHQCRGLTDINWKRLKSVKPGESNSKLKNSEFGDLRLGCHRRLEENGKRGFGDVYTRMHPDRPSPTITTRFHSISNGRFGHYDAEQVRGISLREGASLQSFSEQYVFYGEGMDSVARMIGNAVPPKLSAYMAESLYVLWRDRAEAETA